MAGETTREWLGRKNGNGWGEKEGIGSAFLQVLNIWHCWQGAEALWARSSGVPEGRAWAQAPPESDSSFRTFDVLI